MNYKKHFKSGVDLYTVEGTLEALRGELVESSDGFALDAGELKLETVFFEHSSGVNVRKDTVTNVSDRDIELLTAQSKFVFDGGEYEVYTQYSEWCAEGQGAWQPLVTEVSSGNSDVRANVGTVPFFAIFNKQNERGVAFHILADSKWSMRVKKSYSQTGHRKTVTVELGISDRGFSYNLKAGETLSLPKIIFYEFKNRRDMDAFKLHRYYKDVTPPRSMPVIYNSWMSRFDNISYDILSEQLEVAKAIGAEYFVIDAGWFGRPNDWADQVGEWQESTEYSMQGRMKEFADKVRSYGLKFGIWFEIERAAANSSVVRDYPEHYFKEGKHFFVDFAKPETCEYIFGKVAENVRKYGVEFIKFDHNAEISFDPTNRAFIEYFKGYRAFIKRLGTEFPSLYLQNCASGGLRMALSELDGFDSFWMSDNHSLYVQLEIFKNTMIRMPSRALERWITIRSLEHFEPLYGGGDTEKILVSGDCCWGHMEAVRPDYLRAAIVGGPIGISCDVTKLSPMVLSLLTEEIAKFKAERDFWAKSECRILCDTDSLLVLQFSDSDFNEVKLYSYVKVPHQNEVTVYPVLNYSAKYALAEGTVSGSAIEEDGIVIPVGDRYTAAHLTLKKV